jgi:hypothetical protein
MGSDETNPERCTSKGFFDAQEKVLEGTGIAKILSIAIYILPKKSDFPETLLQDFQEFSKNELFGFTPLRTGGVRYNAVTAEVVTSKGDGEVSRHPTLPPITPLQEMGRRRGEEDALPPVRTSFQDETREGLKVLGARQDAHIG